ncbi:hypothetical protein DSO57_1003298 [Entomophthora muscae]|uniref:Uncharacterized protein n=1 Tax=Entomophthora muscae TaxID=34485 RepID=A0ACC2T8D8_9FUNG|nr:hypothetical protein DSO57_1003298 [Entomophthora muscae]
MEAVGKWNWKVPGQKNNQVYAPCQIEETDPFNNATDPKTLKKKPVPTNKAASKPSSEPSPEQSPYHSAGGEESDVLLTNQSFYNLDSDKEASKQQHQAKKTPPNDKFLFMRSTTTSPLLPPIKLFPF